MASSHSRPKLPLTLEEIKPFISFTAHAWKQERHCEPLRLHSLPRRGRTLREDIPENSLTKDFKLLSDVRIIQRHPINSRVSHQDWVHLFGVNIPLLYLVPHVPGRRSILQKKMEKLQWRSEVTVAGFLCSDITAPCTIVRFVFCSKLAFVCLARGTLLLCVTLKVVYTFLEK